jgi:pimeloyl-ACP methyl ester carboxylesterase
VTEKGVFGNGIPYVRFGKGEKPLLVFSGGPGNDLPSGFMLRMFKSGFKRLAQNYMVFVVTRKFGLPEGYTTRDMSEDYAALIRDEFDGGPIDVVGVSYGGLIAQHLAADHPDLIRRLVIAMAAYKVGDEGKQLDMRFAELMSQGKTREASTTMISILYPGGIKKHLFKFFMWLFGSLIMSKPTNPSDLLVEAKAECEHDSKNRLAEINVPTLVIAGNNDFYFHETLYRETAAGISTARLILYEGVGHMAIGKQFDEDVLEFLSDDGSKG